MNDGRWLVLGALGAAMVARRAMGSRGVARAGRGASRPIRPAWTGPEERFIVSEGKGKPRPTKKKVVSLVELSVKVVLNASIWGVDGSGKVTRELGVLSEPILKRWLAFVVEDAIMAAERALPIFESAVPGDDRPRKAIEAASEALRSPTEANRNAAASAANAAAEAAKAAKDAFFADAAATGPAPASDAANAATNAADAASHTAPADAADAAADAVGFAAPRSSRSSYTATVAVDNATRLEQGHLLLGILQGGSRDWTG